ncbi:hypothetical protein PTKIN_Ptkin14bG0083200 [Pterospermum kingtungense]
MHLQLGELSTIVISSPEAAQQVLQTHGVNFANRPISLATSLICHNFTGFGFSPYGDHRRQLRKICTLELLSVKRVQSFRAIREEEVADFIRQISFRPGSPVNLRKRLRCLSYSIISRAAFGVKYKDQEDFALLVEEMLDFMSRFSLADVFPSLKLLHVISEETSKLKKLNQNFDKILQNIIEEHKARRANTTSCKEEANDLVHLLLNLQDQGELGIPLANPEIKGVIMDMFVGGGESGSSTIEWAISEMLKNLRVLKKAQIERWKEDVSWNVFGITNIELSLAQSLYHFDWKFSDGRKLEDIDMTEVFGLAAGRKHDLCLVPMPYTPMSVE